MTSIVPQKYIDEAFQLQKNLETTFIHLAEHLYFIFEQRLWRQDYPSWDEFLMELKVSTPTASKLMSVYKKYVIEHGVELTQLMKSRSWEGLYYVRSLATSKAKALELVEDNAVLSQKDMRLKVGAVEREACKHEETYVVRICRHCGERTLLYDAPDEFKTAS